MLAIQENSVNATCVECGSPFFAKKPAIAKYCSRPCKDRVNYRNHASARREQQAAYRAAHKAERREYDKAYRAANADYQLSRQRDYYASNPTRFKDATARRRARIRNSPDSRAVSDRDWRRALHAYGHRCAYCGGAGRLEMDHVIPIAKGGRHAVGNIVPACFDCNRSKFDHFLSVWRYRYKGR